MTKKDEVAEQSDGGAQIVRYSAITFDKPVPPVVSNATMGAEFLASDGYVIERDLGRDPSTVRVSHRTRGIKVLDVPWIRVNHSVREEGLVDEAKPVPAACQPPVETPPEPPAVPGAMSDASREALERDGVRVQSPPRKKGGWPGKKKGAPAASEPES